MTGTSGGEEDHCAQKVKAFAWARVSTEEQERRGNSIEQQLREIRTFAERRGVEIVREFSEAASAFSRNGKRPEFEKMVGLARADPDINAIIVHDFSRFSRDSLGGRALFRDLRSEDIKVLSVSDPDIDPETEAGVFAEAFTFAKNEAYSRTLAFHTKKGCRANLRTRDPKSGYCFKNGAMPLWGFKIQHVNYGTAKGGKPIIKSIWVKDETIVAGKPKWEWVRHCLVEHAMKGASVAKLRDFCNEQGIPSRRDKYWNSTSWKDLLYDFNLLKYAGYGVWNVRGPSARRKPVSEWEIVEDAHPAIITEEEAIAIANVRRGIRETYPGPPRGRSRKSHFLLTGGVSVCDRCGKNLVGHKKYYVCGSEPYRGGKGCGPGVYVPQLLLESEIIKDIKGIISKLSDPDRFTRKVNEELRRIWERQTGYDPDAERHIAEIDKKITHIRTLLVNGLDDVVWANSQLRELRVEREELVKARTVPDKPPQVDSDKAMAVRKDLDRVLKHAKPEERKEYVQSWVDRVTLFPEDREIEIHYRVPDSVMNSDSTGSHATGPLADARGSDSWEVHSQATCYDDPV